MRPVFADPKNDLMFHRIFGEEPHKPLLIALLNDLLGLPPARRILSLEYLPATQAPRYEDQKLSNVDVKCIDAAGIRYIVEMQVLNVEGFQKRMVYNLCKAYAGQLQTGDVYSALDDVVAVAICDFLLWPSGRGEPDVPMLSRWRMSEEATGKAGFGQLRYVMLELPKYTAGANPVSVVDKWAYFFRETERFREVPAALSQGAFAEALEVARVGRFSEQEWEAYDRAELEEGSYRGLFTLARREGREEGMQEGMQQGTISSILQVLAARGVAVDEPSRQRIVACGDATRLQAWLARAVTVAGVTEMFGD